jgi:putative membrane protein
MFWGALIGFVTWAIYRFTRRDGSELVVNHVEIAKERYAKGEISKEEFEQIKKDLS